MEQRHLARKHLDQRLAPLRENDPFRRPPRGWLRAIRDALGITTAQLARRMDLSQPRISNIEKGEVRNTVTLDTLRKAAEALDCTLVYALVPNKPLDDILRDRAWRVADAQLDRANNTMRLEDQALTPDDLADERDRLVADLLRGDPRRLWDDV